jgi:hypothetical protein
MANLIVGATNTQQATNVQPTQKATNIQAPAKNNNSSAPQDKVTISSQAHAAHQSIQAQGNAGNGKK